MEECSICKLLEDNSKKVCFTDSICTIFELEKFYKFMVVLNEHRLPYRAEEDHIKNVVEILFRHIIFKDTKLNEELFNKSHWSKIF